MISRIINKLRQINTLINNVAAIAKTVAGNSAGIAAKLDTSSNIWTERRNHRFKDPIYLERYGYKVYSQNDEDGIIAEIFKRIGTINQTFVEFGVQDGLENNTHYLLFQGWRGLWIECGEKKFNKLTEYFQKPLTSKRLLVSKDFVTVENINTIIKNSGICGEIDLLSIDIDGNDYWVWEAINCVQPRVVVIEYNVKFPPPCEYVMPYDAEYVWDGTDCHGASLKSFEMLAEIKGYRLVGTNTVNAFFVKRELAEDLFPEPATAENLYDYGQGHVVKKYIGV